MGGSGLPLAGSREAVLRDVAPISIHGDIYYDVTAEWSDGSGARLRIPADLWGSEPRPGDRARLSFLMGQVDGVEVLGSGDGASSGS